MGDGVRREGGRYGETGRWGMERRGERVGVKEQGDRGRVKGAGTILPCI